MCLFQDGGGKYHGKSQVMTSTAIVTINVIDTQDSPPVFVGTPYFGFVYEVSVPVSMTLFHIYFIYMYVCMCISKIHELLRQCSVFFSVLCPGFRDIHCFCQGRGPEQPQSHPLFHSERSAALLIQCSFQFLNWRAKHLPSCQLVQFIYQVQS